MGRVLDLSKMVVPPELQATEDELVFLRRIKETPDDTAPRLIFSDWLLENGQEQTARYLAEFPLCCGLVPEDEPSRLGDLDWRTGLLDRVNVWSAEVWLKYADLIDRIHPLKEVHLRSVPRWGYVDSDMCRAYLVDYPFGEMEIDAARLCFDKVPNFQPWVPWLLLKHHWSHLEFNIEYADEELCIAAFVG